MRRIRFAILAWVPLVLVACQPSQPYVTPDRQQRGMVIVLPGIEGRSILNESIRQGLTDGGVNWAIEIRDWTSPLGPLYSLRAEERNRKVAEEIAADISKYQADFPGRPVVIVGQSGGGGLAPWVAEALGPNQTIRGLVLINASLSREYKLIRALQHTEQGIVSFHSPKDWAFLGLGTTVTGTMDGEHAESAGKEGFLVPEKLPEEYDKLFQIAWNEQMGESGHAGGHLSSAATAFVARFVAPLVLAETWNQQTIDAARRGQLYRTIDSPVEAPTDDRDPLLHPPDGQ